MVTHRNVIEIVVGRNVPSSGKFVERELPLQSPDVPVLPETLLRLELNIGGTAVCLSELSRILLLDLGATLQLFRLAGHEQSAATTRLNRIEDCISLLGVKACVDAVEEQVIHRDSRKLGIAKAWAHASSIASYCSLWAELSSESINPSEAYLVGLFHELGSLPTLLEWDRNVWRARDQRTTGLRIASQCHLPRCVKDYFSESRISGASTRWSDVVEMAHEFASMPAFPFAADKEAGVQAEEAS